MRPQWTKYLVPFGRKCCNDGHKVSTSANCKKSRSNTKDGQSTGRRPHRFLLGLESLMKMVVESSQWWLHQRAVKYRWRDIPVLPVTACRLLATSAVVQLQQLLYQRRVCRMKNSACRQYWGIRWSKRLRFSNACCMSEAINPIMPARTAENSEYWAIAAPIPWN